MGEKDLCLKSVEDYVEAVEALATRMLELSNRGEGLSTDDRERLLFSVVRDCAYKIKQEVMRQRGLLDPDAY